MASTTHQVEWTDVLEELPVQTAKVTGTSSGVNSSKLTRWIAKAAGQLNAILESRGVDPDTLEDNALETVQAGIIAYAAAKAAPHVPGISDQQIDRYWEEWGSVRKTLRESPDELGKSHAASSSIKSNIDPDEPTHRKFDADGFGGW